jgi:hypothetical protein
MNLLRDHAASMMAAASRSVFEVRSLAPFHSSGGFGDRDIKKIDGA